MLEQNSIYIIQIPANVKTRLELINGFGIKELIQTMIAGLIGLVVAYIVYLIKEVFIISFGIFAGILVIAFLVTMKDKYNQSIAIWLINMVKFYRSQRFYKFVLKENDL